MTTPASSVRELDEDALSAAHLAVEDTLIELRDSRIGVLGRGNGFVVLERDGSPSNIIRLGTRHGLRIALDAYFAALDKKAPVSTLGYTVSYRRAWWVRRLYACSNTERGVAEETARYLRGRGEKSVRITWRKR